VTIDATSPRTFDHAELIQLPEYHALRQALDALAQRLDREQDITDRDGFIAAVTDMARTSYAADDCDHCREPVWPHGADVTDSWMNGRYYCPICNRAWTCGYTADLEIAAMFI